MDGVGTRPGAIPAHLRTGRLPTTSRACTRPLVPAVVNGFDHPGDVRPDGSPATSPIRPSSCRSLAGSIRQPGSSTVRFYRVPLTTLTGTVQIPVTALQGGGHLRDQHPVRGDQTTRPWTADFAYTRVSPAGSSRPAGPRLPVAERLQSRPFPRGPVRWLVPAVLGRLRNGECRRARRSRSAPPAQVLSMTRIPSTIPTGRLRDQNGIDNPGSVAFVALPGVNGTVTLNAKTLGLVPDAEPRRAGRVDSLR